MFIKTKVWSKLVTNNDVLRRIRYTFDLKDKKVVEIFDLTKVKVTQVQVHDWLRKDEDESMVALTDPQLASFLNGFIIEKRGRRDGDLPVTEQCLTKNIILMKLKIALNLQADDIINLLGKNGLAISKGELSAFFRKPDHKNYRQCKAQFLRNFLMGVQDKYRVAPPPKEKINQVKKNVEDKSSNNRNDSSYKKNKKPKAKKIYVNPNATKTESKPATKCSRKLLKLKPEDIYKDS